LEQHAYPPLASLGLALRRRCPRCGKGRLYKSYLSVAEQCDDCGLDYGDVDTGDGPAVFIILIAGFILVGGALYVEVAFRPPYWVHALLWLPAGLILPLIMLPVFKAWLIAQQYRHKAREGRLHE